MAKKDYYQVLGLERNAQDDDIKKAYKTLAIKVHPDKNEAPSASEAFKKVSAAYACLIDFKKRKIYDLIGEEPTTVPGDGGGFNDRELFQDDSFENSIDPEEIFRMFFAGGLFDENRVHFRKNDPNYKTNREKKEEEERGREQGRK